MLKSQFDYLCNSYGDSSVSEEDRWKSIKYIYNENPLFDVQTLIKENRIIYIDNIAVGPGFYVLEAPYAFSMANSDELVITFIPLSVIDKISFVTNYITSNKTNTPNEQPISKGPLYKAVSNNSNETEYSDILQ